MLTQGEQLKKAYDKCRVAEVLRRDEGRSPTNFEMDENFKPQYPVFCRDIKICRKLHTFWKSSNKKSALLGQRQYS